MAVLDGEIERGAVSASLPGAYGFFDEGHTIPRNGCAIGAEL